MYDIAKLDTEHNLFLRICALVCTCVTRNGCTISFLIDNKTLPQYVPDLLYLLRNDTPGASDKKNIALYWQQIGIENHISPIDDEL